ncbi:hypothetical protein VNO78_13245 [Psophocarpus tetragonolobus]|uniref:Peptidase A1 domain-containing protein n=1 Tax=Psophocarpus tetragonolobus TaxID=3891 RepID=A0AAN9SNY4_PSOTE
MFTFVCTYYNMESPDATKMTTGVVGLGKGPLSLVSQLGNQIGSRFSYCLIPYGLNATSKLKFGDETTIKGKGVVSTPLIIKSSQPNFYYVNFEGISIGEKIVKMSKSETYGNMLIDSGTTHTMLEHSFYSKFVTLVKEVYGGEAVKNPPAPYDFCMSGEDTKNLLLKYTKDSSNDEDNNDNLPDFVFHFTGGAKIKLNSATQIFNLVDGYLCMLIHPANEDGFNVLGNVQQMGYQVEYDLGGGKVSFAPADCAKY